MYYMFLPMRLKRMLGQANQMVIGSDEWFKAMIEYHSCCAEYFDSRVGDSSNKDDEYTAQLNKHNDLLDKFNRAFNKKNQLSEVIAVGIDNGKVKLLHNPHSNFITVEIFGVKVGSFKANIQDAEIVNRLFKSLE